MSWRMRSSVVLLLDPAIHWRNRCRFPPVLGAPAVLVRAQRKKLLLLLWRGHARITFSCSKVLCQDFIGLAGPFTIHPCCQLELLLDGSKGRVDDFPGHRRSLDG